MNPDSSNSASDTATTSTNAPSKPGEKKPHGPQDKPASEADFLTRQAAEAKAALSAAFGDLSRGLRDGVDPSAWTKEHPWAMVAGAAVAGFAAAAVFVPSKEDQALRRLAKLERALMPKPATAKAAHHDAEEDGGARDFSRGRSGFLAAMGRQVLETIKPALMSALTAGITAKAATPDAQQTPPPPQGYAQGQPAAPADPSAAI